MKPRSYLLLLVLGLGLIVASHAASPAPNSAVPKTPPKPNPNGVSLAELKELSAARQKALKADPSLAKAEADLQQKIRDFQQKVDALVVQSNPDLRPLITQLESTPVPRLPPLPPGSLAPPTNAAPVSPAASPH